MKIPFLARFREVRQTTPAALADFIRGSDLDYGRGSNSGKYVSEDTALQVSAVYACVRVLAETIASLPLPLYMREKTSGKSKAYSHPLYPVLHDLTNSDMTSFTFRELRVKPWNTISAFRKSESAAWRPARRKCGSIGLSESSFKKLTTLLFAVLAAWGIFNNPTSKDGY